MEIGKTFNPYGLFVGSFIPNCILQEKLLSSTAKLCYARLCQYSGKNGVAFPKQETLAKEIGISEVQVIRVLKNLEDFGLIKRIKATGQDKFLHKTNRYTFLWHKIYEQDDSSVANADDSSKRIKVLRESDEIHGVSNETQRVSSHTKDKGEKPASQETKEIITYLNETLQAKFSGRAVATQKHINARLQEGYTVEDFKMVIEFKWLKWKNDEKMCQYLRPSTLFNSEKFGGYLEDARRNLKKEKVQWE